MTEMYMKKWMGHLAAAGAYLIFGFNIVVCKDLTSHPYVSPIGIFLLRSVGAGLIFWLLSIFTRREKVARRDLLGIFFASVLGFFLTQMTFLIAVPMIKPVETALLGSMTPIYTMFIAAVAVHEPITLKKAGGVALSFGSIIFLILTGMSGGGDGALGGGSSVAGLLLMALNPVCFALYLGIFRPLIKRYSVVTFMKWIFLFSTLMALPWGLPDVIEARIFTLPGEWLLELAYLIVMATFVAYFLIPLGQKIIRPTLVSMYSYLQPIIAIAVSIAVGMDTLTVPKVAATLLVFTGVYIVSRSRSASIPSNGK